MSVDQAKALKVQVEQSSPEKVCGTLLENVDVAACADQNAYTQYKEHVREVIGRAVESVFIAGSGNWGFSLNPAKQYRTFGDWSDIDLCIVSPDYFDEIWTVLRHHHRKNFYRMPYAKRMALRRNGENVYAGFVCPLWLNDPGHPFQIDFQFKLNLLSSAHVSYKEVNAFVFKNLDEAIDYYKRGVMALLKDQL